MPAINLLPEEFASGAVVKIMRLVKKILPPAFIVFFVSVAVMLGIIIVLNGSLKRIDNSQKTLTASIKNLEKTEKGMLLLQERLAKIKLIFSTDSSKENFTQNTQDILERSSGVKISEIETVPGKINLMVEVTTSDKMEEFLSRLFEGRFFKKAVLTDFSFSPTVGYRLGLEFTTK